ncbi:MAG: hydroxymethylglutaryl-CoA synthase [Deltaproteobacteria bacterium]|nr:hydroxymethylglutaryl-CoA synthase [Deltaproteobacteria bacterium]
MDLQDRRIGIEALAVHLPRNYLDLGVLARANGTDPEKYYFGLGCRRMAIPSADEDSVVLAARAAGTLLAGYGIEASSIGMVLVGTESGVDAAKPIATYVHRMAGLPSDCRAFDVQHACYGGMAALRTAANWVQSGLGRGRKALVIATDVARYDVGSPGEPTQGAAAVAMLVGDEPRVLELLPYPEAVHTAEVMDFWRPTYRSTALADGHYSMQCYLDALESCWHRFASATDLGLEAFDFLLYHSPFPKMAFKAHRRLCELAPGGTARGGADLDWERRVLPTLWANIEVGNAYSASLFVSLAGLLEHAEVDAAGARLGLFSYGSGSCAEFVAARVGPDAAAWRDRTGLRAALERRRELTHEAYLRSRRAYEERARDGSFRAALGGDGPAFCGTWNHQRVYRDSAWRAATGPSRSLDRPPRSAGPVAAPLPHRAQAAD